MKKLLLILLFLSTGSGLAYSQGRTVKGRVTSSAGEEALPGVSIQVKGTSSGTVTDVDGRYSINVSEENVVLVFSFVGFISEEIKVGNRSVIDVRLSEDLRHLSEIVVVGYGTQTRQTITGAISSVKSEELTQLPVPRIEQALQGRVAGVQVTANNGQPGEAPTIRIRGAGTTGNANPLYIVDGFPVGGIDFLNPGDIESIEVLKDAASASIYGARGANGVVLITTKMGKKGDKFRVSYDGYRGVQNPWRKMEVLNAREYAMMMNEGRANDRNTPLFPNPASYGEGTDWQQELFNWNAPIQNHQFSITGGSEKSAYASTFSYFSQEGIVGGEKSQFDRYTFRLNGDTDVNSFLKVTTNVAYTGIKRRAIDGNQEFGGLLSNAINLDPITPLYETNPDVLSKAPYTDPRAVRNSAGQYYGIGRIGSEVVNPLAFLETLHGSTKVDKLVGNVMGTVKLTEELSFNSSYGIDLAYVVNDHYTPLRYLNPFSRTDFTTVSKSFNRYFTWQNENVLKYEKGIDKHNFTAMVGTTALRGSFENLGAASQGLLTPNPNNAYIDLTENRNTGNGVGGGASRRALLSVFSRVNYNFDNKYLLSATLRRDGSSRFGVNNKFATFPAFSAGYVLSEESFMKNFKNLSFFKVRASWGQNGSEEIGGVYPWAATLTTVGYTQPAPDGGHFWRIGTIPGRIPNPDLKWETSEQIDIGIDFAFFEDALSFAIDFYDKKTKGLLVDAPIPFIVGNNPPTVNGGTVLNRGVEFAMNYSGKVNELKFNAGLNFTYNHNEVTAINNAEGRIIGGSYSVYGTIARAEVGYPIGYFWGLQTDGVFQNQSEINAHVGPEGKLIQPDARPGDFRFVDRDGDGVIGDNDKTYIGNPTPKYTAGMNLSASYKSFDFSAFVTGAFGHDIFNATRRNDLGQTNMSRRFLDRWTGEGSTNSMPRFSIEDPNGNYRPSDFYLEDGSFVRVRTLQLGYSLPKSLIERVSVERMRIYVAGDNMFTFTKYSGFDPEIGARGSLDIGVDRGVYPQPKMMRVGLNVTF